MIRRSLFVLLVGIAGCVGSRPPLEATRLRLAAAATPEARTAAAVERLATTGVAPLAGGFVRPLPAPVYAFGTPPIVGGIVPGQTPARRLELVTLATALDGAAAAETIEAARHLVARRPHGEPARSVLVALWPMGLTPAEGLARVNAMPLWPDSLRIATLVVGPTAPAGATALDAAGLTGEALVARIVAAVLAADREAATGSSTSSAPPPGGGRP